MWGVDFNASRKFLYEFLEVGEDDSQKVMKMCAMSEEEFREKTRELYEWARNHPGLPQPAKDKIYLRQQLIQSQFDPVRAKKKSEGFFKLMELYPEIFRNLGTVNYREESAIFAISPVRTPDFERVFIFCMNPENQHKVPDGDKVLNMITTLMMLVLESDYSRGIRIVADFRHLKYQHSLKFTPNLIWKLLKLYTLGVPTRINGIEMVNASKYVASSWAVIKSIFGHRLIERVNLHEDFESLYRVVPKGCLPREIGGDLGSIQAWIGILDKIVGGYKGAAEKVASFVPRDEDLFYGAFM